MSKALKVKNLSVSYGKTQAIKDITFSMDTGRLIGIVGPNGSGKSTIIKAILDLVHIDQGEIEILGSSLNKVRKEIAYQPQHSNIDWDFPIIVKDTVLLGTYPKLGLFKRPGKKEKDWAMQCLEKVGMEDYSERQIGELSGGQQQRVFLARALAQKAECFFLDEPFVGIDVSSEEVIINILRELRDKGKTVFVVHHDLMKVESYFDDLIVVNKTLIGAGPVETVFQPGIMKEAYQDPLAMIRKFDGKKCQGKKCQGRKFKGGKK